MAIKSSIVDSFKSGTELSGKLVLGFFLFITIMLLVVGTVLYMFISTVLKKESHERIEVAVLSATQMIDQSVTHAIQSQLRATADRNRDIISFFYQEFKSGKMTEAEAKKRVSEILLAQKIGSTGYMVVVDSKGTLRVHPKAEFVNRDVSNLPFVQRQIKQKTGYMEYEWKNPGEKKARPKSASMSYFKPWDYIISASAYKEEFFSLVNLRQFKREIMEFQFGQSGYAYVMDLKGTLIIHPDMEGKNLYNAKDETGRYFVREMCAKKNGTISYLWKNPGEKRARIKDVIFRYYPNLDIIVAGGFYREELYAPLEQLKKRLALVFAIVMLVGLSLAFIFVKAIASPILRLSSVSASIARKDLRVLPEFDRMESENQKWFFRITGNSREMRSLISALRDAGMTIRSLIGNLVVNARKLSAQADLIQNAADHSRTGASNQSAIVAEVSKTIDSLQNKFKSTEKIAKDVFAVSEQAVRKGQEGSIAVRGTLNSMKSSLKTTEAARLQLTALADVSNQIALVVKALEDIADNSQMLAINASIEAAEAGEAGRGFAVVAAEVQELAVQSGKSTQNIRNFLQQIAETATLAIKLTEENQRSVEQGQISLGRMEKVLQSLTGVLDSNNQHADQIARTVAEQSVAIAEISTAVGHVLENSQASSQSVAELLSAVEELKITRQIFDDLAAEYKV
ncbi:MAG: methyl-accepting chemotaxis protein [Deltaproteobacteria bacterium]|nr:methyl-accepting chemotaxis protein [Deltaproteobacteria bacterium]